MKKDTVDIFFACEDASMKCTVESLRSIIKNSNKDYKYRVHILCSESNGEYVDTLLAMESESFDIEFNDISEYLSDISKSIPIKDYNSKTACFRFLIADAWKSLDRAIYIDGDTAVAGDISELFFADIGENFAGACRENAVGTNGYDFFNAGILVIDCKRFRKKKILKKFKKLATQIPLVGRELRPDAP